MVGAVCLGVVIIRAERVRLEARTQADEARLIALSREIWTLQLERARLCSPGRIDDRARRMGLEVRAPSDVGRPQQTRMERLADRGR
jgi:hypothetical protein